MSTTREHSARSVLDQFYDAERAYMSAAPQNRDFQPIADMLSPNFQLEQTSALPYAGVYDGSAGMQDWMSRMAGYFNVVDVQNSEVLERKGSSRVVVLSTLHLRVRETGVEVDFPFCQVVTVDLEKGLMVRMQPFYWDVQALNRVVGYSP